MKKQLRIFLIITTLSAISLLAACNGVSQPPVKEPAPPPVPAPQEKSPPQTKPEPEDTTNFPLTVTDDLGRKVTINKIPQGGLNI